MPIFFEHPPHGRARYSTSQRSVPSFPALNGGASSAPWQGSHLDLNQDGAGRLRDGVL